MEPWAYFAHATANVLTGGIFLKNFDFSDSELLMGISNYKNFYFFILILNIKIFSMHIHVKCKENIHYKKK